MAYPRFFLSLANFELAFVRIVRGQNREYKHFYRHILPSYQLTLKENLKDLIDDIKRGTYRPDQGILIFQPKKTGILRPLRLLTLRDLIVYQAIVNVIASAFKSEQDKYASKKCFGALFAGKNSLFFYRRWKECYREYTKAIEKAFNSGNTFVADFDLVSFYELIDHNLLRAHLEKSFKNNNELLDLLFNCLEQWTINKKGAHLHHGIPQGPEPSAFLAECVLFKFDALKFKDVKYIRYVDDIKLLARDEVPVRRALLRLDIASKELGLVPQAQKIELRQINNFSDLLKTVPSGIAIMPVAERVPSKIHIRLEKMFRRSLRKEKRQWIVDDIAKFKFSLTRMNPKQTILKRIAPLLVKRPDLSGIFLNYLKKFQESKVAANIVLDALKKDPTYDASAANYIEAMNICEPTKNNTRYRRIIQSAKKRSVEKSILLNIAVGTFRGRRGSPLDATRLIDKESDPIVKSILIHRLFGEEPNAPFKITQCLNLLEREVESNYDDLARFSASLLLGIWPWGVKGHWHPSTNVNNSVKLLMKGLGLRKKTPKKLGVLDIFFQEQMRIGMSLPWKKALGKDWRDAERRCLRLQKFQVGDPTARVLILDTFNEVLLQRFSKKHANLVTAYIKASGQNSNPDFGNWLNNSAIATILPKGISWFKAVHTARVGADLAHAKMKSGKVKGKSTKPITYKKADDLMKRAQKPWAELIDEWKKIL